MTRILHVVTSVDPALGGVAESIRARGVKLLEMGHHVEVVSLDEPGHPALQGYPLPLHTLGKGISAWQLHFGLVPWLRAHCREFDAVIVDGLWQFHGFAVRRALRGTGVPYFVFPHGMLDPWFKRSYPLKHLKKWLFWPWCEYRVLRDAAAVLFTCEEERLSARQSFGLYRAREAVVTLGIEVPTGDRQALAEQFLQQRPELQGRELLLFLGRLHPKKGCDLLIAAAAATLRDQAARLSIVMAGPGEADYVQALRQEADRQGVADQFLWLGMLRGDAKWGALCAASAFVLPSHQENFGIAVVEALACGVPVLISDKVNIWREVAQDACGLVEPDTAAGTTALLARWRQLPGAARERMATDARQSYARRYTSHAAAETFLAALSTFPVARQDAPPLQA